MCTWNLYLEYVLVAGDFNGDGHVDLVVNTDNSPAAVALLPGNGDGTFGPARELIGASSANSQGQLVAGDFNRDGRLDLATPPPVVNGNKIAVWLNRGKGKFVKDRTYTVGLGAISLATADLNGDGYLDLVTANVNDNMLNKGNHSGTFHPATSYTGVAVSSGSFSPT